MARIILHASRFTWESIKVSSLPHLRRESIEPVCRVRPCSTTTAEECCCSSLAPVWPASLPSWTTCSCDHLMTSRLTHRQHHWRHSASLCQTTTHVRRHQRLKPTIQLQNCPFIQQTDYSCGSRVCDILISVLGEGPTICSFVRSPAAWPIRMPWLQSARYASVSSINTKAKIILKTQKLPILYACST